MEQARVRSEIADQKRNVVVKTVLKRRHEGKQILNSKVICEEVKATYDIEVAEKLVRNVMKSDLNLSFVKSKKLSLNANSDRALVLRQQYALKMFDLLGEGKRIINLDETWINETSFVRRTWAEKNGEGNVLLNAVVSRLAMITAIDTEGNVWFSLTQVNTNSSIIALFLEHLSKKLDREMPGWQDDTVLLWDNAKYHTSKDTRNVLKKLGINAIYSGPYSYSAAPAELLFSGMKMNPQNPKTPH